LNMNSSNSLTPVKRGENLRRKPQLISPLGSVTKLAKPPRTPRSPPPIVPSQPWLPAGNAEIPFSPLPVGAAALSSRVAHYQTSLAKLEASIARHEAREVALAEENAYLQERLNKYMSTNSSSSDEIDDTNERLVRDVGKSADSIHILSDANKVMTDLTNVLQKKLSIREAELMRLEESLQKAISALSEETRKKDLLFQENEELKSLASDLHSELETAKTQLSSTKKSLESAHLREADSTANLSSNSLAVAEFASRSTEAARALELAKEELSSQQRVSVELKKQLESVIFESKALRSQAEAEAIQLQDRIFELERSVRLNSLQKASEKAVSASLSSSVNGSSDTASRIEAIPSEEGNKYLQVVEQYESSQRSLETSRLEIKHLNAKIAEIESSCTTLKAKLSRAEAESERHASHALQMEHAVNDCDSRIDSIFERVSLLGNTVSSSEESMRQLSSEKSRLQKEKDSLVTQLEDVTAQRDTARQQVADAEARLERTQLDFEAEQNESKSLKRSVSNLRSEVDRLRTDLARAQVAVVSHPHSQLHSSSMGQSFAAEGLWRQRTSSGSNNSMNSSVLSVTDLQLHNHTKNNHQMLSSVSPTRPLALRVSTSPTQGNNNASSINTNSKMNLSLTSDVSALVASLKRDLEDAKRRLGASRIS
jgi:chromosome segregation ATPase